MFNRVLHLPYSDEPCMRWYEPCATERTAFDRHLDLQANLHHTKKEIFYLGFPWATWIDFLFCEKKKSDFCIQLILNEIDLLEIRILDYRSSKDAKDHSYSFHTVCQHVYWRKMLPVWSRLGVTDLWLSHCELGLAGTSIDGITLHSWPLYAVNIENPKRHVGLDIGRPTDKRKLLASFTGAQLPFYISDVRDHLPLLNDFPGFEIYVNSEWHFEAQVQANQKGYEYESDTVRDYFEVETYNQQLSDSIFALCPSGSGPNTIRLWEALAVGTIPVLMGFLPELPITTDVTSQMWKQAVVEFTNKDLTALPEFLNSISFEERVTRQAMCMAIYGKLKNITCF